MITIVDISPSNSDQVSEMIFSTYEEVKISNPRVKETIESYIRDNMGDVRDLYNHYTEKGNFYKIALDSGEIVGGIGLEINEYGYEIRRLFVIKEHRHKGTASKLIRDIIKVYIRQVSTMREIPDLVLRTTSYFEDAYRLYLYLGFEVTRKTESREFVLYDMKYKSDKIRIRPLKFEKIQFIGEDTNTKMIEFACHEFSYSEMNSLRRGLMKYVPSVSISEVLVNKNTSQLDDEILVHRLGLIPIDNRRFYENFKANDRILPFFTSREFGSLQLKISTTDTKVVVYSKDIKSVDDAPMPISDDIVIVELQPGEEIDIEMFFSVGTSQDHARFNIFGPVGYQNVVKITVNPLDPDFGRLKDVCPRYDKIFNPTGGIKNAGECIQCMDCKKSKDTFGLIEIEPVINEFRLFVEPIGVLDLSQIQELVYFFA